MNKSVNKKFVAALVLSLWLGIAFGSQVFSANDGNLLRRTNQGDNTCGGPTNACHNLKVHNATNTESTYWSSNWGLTGGKYGKFVCQTCHTPHNTSNIFLIKEKIKFPDGTSMPSQLTESTVDFRYRSSVDASPGLLPVYTNANYVMGNDETTATGRPSTSQRVCEVCHSLTKHHRYNTSNQTDGLTHKNAQQCTGCHYHTLGFIKPGEGGASCDNCHPTITAPMLGNTATADGKSQYHMVMENVDITTITSGTGTSNNGIGTSNKYPAEPTPAASSPHRRCLMCHAEMENFSPKKNAGSPGRAYNLRKSITSAPSNQTDISQLTNTDYDKGTSSGICTSCHQNQQTKDATHQTTADNTTYTPVINPALFTNSPHNYTVDVTNAFGDNTTFKANCVKCHNDTLTKDKQTTASYQFGVHASTVRRLNAVTNANETSASPTYNKTNYGTATGGTTTTVVDTNKNWTTNMWANRPVSILRGTGSSQTSWVSSNTSTTLTIATLGTAPSGGSVYLIGDSRGVDSGIPTGATATTLTDTTKAWETNYWKNRLITIVKDTGTGIGQTRKIVSNTATALTISPSWTTTPGTGTDNKYSIGDPMEEDFCFKCHSMTNPNAATKKDYYGAATIVNGKMLRMEDMFMTYTGTGGAGNNADTTNCPSASYPTSTSLVITPSPAWNTGKWAGYAIRITSGSGVGEIKKITGSGASFLCLDTDWITVPAAASTYEIGQIRHRIDAYSGVHRTDEAITAPTISTSTPAGWFTTTGANPTYHNGCTDCHNPHAQKKPGDDYGTATSGAATTITDTYKAWTQDQWRGYNLRLMDGTGAGQDRMIVSNTTNGTIYVGAAFSTSPTSGTYYTIVPTGRPDKGNSLAGPNNGQWGVDVTPADYPTPAVGSYSNPTFTKNTSLVSGSDKIYELCFKCHSDYGWGNNGTPFNIVDAPSTTRNVYQTTVSMASTNVAREFNPHNVGYHPVVDIGANQPITPMGNGTPIDSDTGTSASWVTSKGATTLTATGKTWSTNQWANYCVAITSGTQNGQIRNITANAGTNLSLDPSLGIDTTGNFAIRKTCSIFNNGTDYSGNAPTSWPRFTRGTITLTAGSSTATIALGASSNGIPSTVIPGWYLYAGTLNTLTEEPDTSLNKLNQCSGTAPCPPMLTTSGWFQVTGITANASGTGQTSVTLNITPPPTVAYSGTYALTAGLGNNFIPPYGPWSVIACTDCHDTDSPTDPSGPHGSARPWILRQLEAQSFPWFYGGAAGVDASTTTTDVTQVKTISYPDGTGTWVNASGNMPNYMCLNCHRSDIYGYEDSSPISGKSTVPSGTGFTNFSWRIMSRMAHVPDTQGAPVGSDGATSAGINIYGIMCMNCHGGDARDLKTAGTENQALGGIHGSNLGNPAIGSPLSTGYRGRRLLNGAMWNGVKRASTFTAIACYTLTVDTGIASCGGGHTGDKTGAIANYPYYSGDDM